MEDSLHDRVSIRAGSVEIVVNSDRAPRSPQPTSPVPYRLPISAPLLTSAVLGFVAVLMLVASAVLRFEYPVLWYASAALMLSALFFAAYGWRQRSHAEQLREADGSIVDPSVAAERATRVAAALSSVGDQKMHVEDLAGRLAWSEDAVVSGLWWLMEHDRVEEDLDLDSGHWTYCLKNNDVSGLAHLSLEDRAKRPSTHNIETGQSQDER